MIRQRIADIKTPYLLLVLALELSTAVTAGESSARLDEVVRSAIEDQSPKSLQRLFLQPEAQAVSAPRKSTGRLVNEMQSWPVGLRRAAARFLTHSLRGMAIEAAELSEEYLEGAPDPIHPPDYVMGWELNNHRALRKNQRKIVMSQPILGDGQWKLYNLSSDPSERIDLSEEYPRVFEMMLRHWEDYVAENGLVLLESGGRGAHR